ncbi:uncharacterized protein LOC34624533 [Cyclospora cayetanensis]|uniref:Uncharacterized protein LOC34624533 n=1 Tax=Cyclospora cayetanensis TaxID=88456 RepID=A0A6P6S0V1_9EIME|nr:uncharacterized protein LOC34624533 [Cyclospora cayetanensis]
MSTGEDSAAVTAPAAAGAAAVSTSSQQPVAASMPFDARPSAASAVASAAGATVAAKTATQAAAARAAADSAAEAAAAAQGFVAVSGMRQASGLTAPIEASETGGGDGGERLSAQRLTAGEEAATVAARAAADAAAAAAEATSAAAAVAEAASFDPDQPVASQLEEFVISQGMRVAIALEAAATAAAAAAVAAGHAAAEATRQATETSSSAIAKAAQRCHEAAASACASASAAFAAAAASAADSVAATAAAARAALADATGGVAQRLVDTAKAVEDAIAVRTAALENAFLGRTAADSESSDSMMQSRSSRSSSFRYGIRSSTPRLSHTSSSRGSGFDGRRLRRDRSSLLQGFSSYFEREGSQGGAAPGGFFPYHSETSGVLAGADAGASAGLPRGEAVVAALLADSGDKTAPRFLQPRQAGNLDIDASASSDSRSEALPLQPPALVATQAAASEFLGEDSVDAIVAAAAAEAAAYEALAQQQLQQQHEANGSFSRSLSLVHAALPPSTAAHADMGADEEEAPGQQKLMQLQGTHSSSAKKRAVAAMNAAGNTIPILAMQYHLLRAEGRCLKLTLLAKGTATKAAAASMRAAAAMHLPWSYRWKALSSTAMPVTISAAPGGAPTVEFECLCVSALIRASDAAEQDDEDEAVTLAAVFIGQALLASPYFSLPSIALQQQGSSSSTASFWGGNEETVKQLLLRLPFACISIADLMSLLPSIGDPRVHGRIGGLEATASALQDSLSFNLFVEVLQQVQQQNLLPTLLLLRIVGYSNADLRKSLSPQQQRRVWQLQQQAAEGKWVPQNAAAAAFAATHLETEGAQEDCATDRSASSSKIGRRKKKWAQRPLYVPPLQLQRSLRTLCRLLPQLRRLELLHPQAAATAPTQAGAAPAFSRLHRLIAYVSPFSVLAESLGFQLLSIKITELLQCCACCCSGWCSASKLCSSHGMHCTEASGGMRRINGSGVSGIDSSSSVDSSAESSEDSGKEQQCSSVKSTTAAAAYSESEFAGSTGFHKKPVQITTRKQKATFTEDRAEEIRIEQQTLESSRFGHGGAPMASPTGLLNTDLFEAYACVGLNPCDIAAPNKSSRDTGRERWQQGGQATAQVSIRKEESSGGKEESCRKAGVGCATRRRSPLGRCFFPPLFALGLYYTNKTDGKRRRLVVYSSRYAVRGNERRRSKQAAAKGDTSGRDPIQKSMENCTMPRKYAREK